LARKARAHSIVTRAPCCWRKGPWNTWGQLRGPFRAAFAIKGIDMHFKTMTAVALTLAIATGGFVHADTAKPAFGTWGLDNAAMDKSVKPGDDFYRYMNGHWLATATIPADRTFNGIDNVINDELNRRMRT